MILTVKSNGMVLKDSPEIKLNKFTVLMGENGSGKTQLLNCIKENPLPRRNYSDEIINTSIQKHSGGFYNNIVLTLPGITEPPENKISPSIFYESFQNEWEQLIPILYASDFAIDPNLDIKNIGHEALNMNDKIEQFVSKMITNPYPNHSIRKVVNSDIIKTIKLKNNTKKTSLNINFNDFIIFYETSNSVFSPYIDLLFHQFELKKKYYPELVEGQKPPLVLFNEILQSANFRYLAKYTFTSDNEFNGNVTLVDIDNNNIISFESLSSGEKTIMALIFTLYSSTSGGAFPELILFDEPDAHLHPSMAQMFLDVVQNVLVKKNGVDVIMTTHSPSTVALSPEESIYYMKRDIGYPVKISREDAINSLIYGISGLFVSYENRRQVFVESANDVLFYDKIYSILKDKLNPKIHLSFISAGDSRTNKHGMPVTGCAQVKHITKTLTDSGNNLIWGIVDRDESNTNVEHTLVFGNKSRYRYAIENYLLDPILLGVLLVKENIMTLQDFDLEYENFEDINQFTNDDFQHIADIILDIIDPIIDTRDDVNLIKTILMNGMTINLPTWFTEHRGHKLEDLIVDTFPDLDKIKGKKENALKLEIIKKVIIPTPGLLAIDFFETFKYIEDN
ncbi:AAA family ATPase [Arcicella aquatica]|uniref:AAA family ATPase n=1 Tax=Arcicella aquatica TaxID=217141 RepID=A0ABU5QJG7_9BACT|nr:AAA family ATPase [Arcicella aquatica]MEA5257178.1 AAA family ATPase [Arcicella aquatica]